MQAELKIAGLDEIIKSVVEEAVKDAVEKIVKPVLKEFKTEVVVMSQDSLMQENLWTKKDICKFARCGETTFFKKYRNHKDFPKPLDTGENKLKFNKIEVLKFFARHPEFGLDDIAKRYLKEEKWKE